MTSEATPCDYDYDYAVGDAAARSACAEGQSVDRASAASALGSTQSYCFTPDAGGSPIGNPTEGRRVRWAARAMLWQASSLKAVRCCGRMLHNDGVGDPDDGQGVAIRRREVNGQIVASYQGLMTCGSVWSCPRCSKVIAHSRAAEITAAVRECFRQGGMVYMMTLTMRHSSQDRLADLWNALSLGWRSSFGGRAWTGQRARTAQRNGRSVQIREISGDAERFDVAGMTRVIEATYGSPAEGGHGWHLHIHALIFCASRMGAAVRGGLPTWIPSGTDREWLGRNGFAAKVYARWSAGLQKAGFSKPGSVAVDIREVTDEGAECIGRYLSKATYDAGTKMGLEIATGHSTKDGRLARNRTPFEVLADLATSVDARGFGVRTPRRWSVESAGGGDWAILDAETGEVIAVTPPGEWSVWHEWEQASKGRRQLLWSRRRKQTGSRREELWNMLLDRRGLTAEQSDEDLAAVEVDGETIGEISRADWYRVIIWRPELIAEILECAERQGVLAVEQMLSGLGVTLKRPPPSNRLSAARPGETLSGGSLLNSRREYAMQSW